MIPDGHLTILAGYHKLPSIRAPRRREPSIARALVPRDLAEFAPAPANVVQKDVVRISDDEHGRTIWRDRGCGRCIALINTDDAARRPRRSSP